MSKLTLAVAGGIALLSVVSAQAQDRELRVDCGATDVIMSVDQVVVIKENTDMTGEEIAARTCDIFRQVDASAFTEPTNVTVTMPSGAQVKAKMQVSQK
ncbi:hypothetical protein [Paracoccus benzoatiresistens]|uniref:Uncharacterized protein n=1 Tax=Paracoccus benzoatiresistens TaxID=2997341 RepID=A0ABT4J1U2_9RHOB|nr:hypothetical protein [Paracoccus sp. EF6]MCZ0961079.1 hypothetical protein [Paracoccus sp. EF6]